MSILANLTNYSASQARDHLYELVKSASKGVRGYEITLRGSQPVVLISKEELESWQETLDILANTEEINSIRKAKKNKTTIPHKKMLKTIGFDK